MSNTVVTIGYILLVPSLVGMAAAVALWAVTILAAVNTRDPALSALGIGLSTVTYLLVGVAAFVSGLLGWLLVMKKTILQCDFCGAVTPAS